MHPLLIVISAPSGAGKSTLCDRLLAERSDIVYSISCTTRKPRGDEMNEKDYFFLTEKQFDEDVKAGKFLEYAVVHGHKYGTPRKMVNDAMCAGKSVIMDIDVQGARQIRNFTRALPNGDLLKAGYVDIFISPPSIQVLKERLEKRGEDSLGEIKCRLKNAGEEMQNMGEYRYVIVNDNLDRAYSELKEVLKNETENKK
ncbi:MAG: guanylate kinase [Kiritimatiellae bacterium]|nr:guanylate kinase [Kiritimatiellia bacterium]MDD5521462.1 guanylate kinase [Kiritimatiellia bacterium]